MKTNFKHIALSYFILVILGIQTGMHFFHDHSHRRSVESTSKVILSENTSDCLVCSLHVFNDLFFVCSDTFICLNGIVIHYINVSTEHIYFHKFLHIQGRAPPEYTSVLG